MCPIATQWADLEKPSTEKTVLCFSGGIESTTTFLWLIRQGVQVRGFYVNYGQKNAAAELQTVRHWCDKYHMPLTVFECPLHELVTCDIVDGGHENRENIISRNVMEGRNLALLSLAVMCAAGWDVHHVYIGFNQEPYHRPFPDATIETWRTFQALCDVSLRIPMTIHAPFAALPRLEIFRGGLALDPTLPDHLCTCFEQVDKACGWCDHCLQFKAMLDALRVYG